MVPVDNRQRGAVRRPEDKARKRRIGIQHLHIRTVADDGVSLAAREQDGAEDGGEAGHRRAFRPLFLSVAGFTVQCSPLPYENVSFPMAFALWRISVGFPRPRCRLKTT